ncbi:hypothetical protein VTN49DRAFT_3856 [Thermomyces lanuginosus]|uniref:uncharacterized protein n=1 Tax=Thermomyces lanuginosus TaxID=5541 RepID=UPI003743C590
MVFQARRTRGRRRDCRSDAEIDASFAIDGRHCGIRCHPVSWFGVGDSVTRVPDRQSLRKSQEQAVDKK